MCSGYKALTLEWFERCGDVSKQLLELLSIALRLPRLELENRFGENRQSLLKYIHYPPTPEGAAEPRPTPPSRCPAFHNSCQYRRASHTHHLQHGAVRVHVWIGGQGVGLHQDTGFFTLLAPGDDGLEVQLPTGEMLPVGKRAGAFIVNLGEALQLITGNYFLATPHRVFARTERYSIGFFYGPSLDFSLRPLELEASLRREVEASERHRVSGVMPTRDQIDSGFEGSRAGMPICTAATAVDRLRPLRKITCVESNAAGVSHETYGDQLWAYFSRAYPELMKLHHGC
jgi:isopenicillin N synthase-like dioxygenase